MTTTARKPCKPRPPRRPKSRNAPPTTAATLQRIGHFPIRATYDAAKTTAENAKHWAAVDYLSADAANNPEVRRELRARARHEVLNNTYARALVQTLTNYCIGTGPRLQVIHDNNETANAIENAWAEWVDEQNLLQKLRTARLARAQDGESFLLLSNNPTQENPVSLAVVPIEADQIATPWAVDEANATDGIEFDPWGQPETYHVLRAHPGARTWTQSAWADPLKIPARYMLHHFRPNRPGERRGIPEITPAIPLFAQLRRYTLAVIAAAETAADFAAVIYTDSPADDSDAPPETFDLITLERRMATILPKSYKLGQMQAQQPCSTYAEFKKEILAEIFRSCLVPLNVGSGTSSGLNYASGRLDLQAFWLSIKVDQKDTEGRVVNPIFRAWYNEARTIPGYLPADAPTYPRRAWHWPVAEHVDPWKEAQAAARRIEIGISNRTIEAERNGLDAEELDKLTARENARADALGLDFSRKPAPTIDPPGDPADVYDLAEVTPTPNPQIYQPTGAPDYAE